jgi:hypothetical protein
VYDGVDYAPTTEGDVAYAIASAISRRGGALMDHKPRIKTAAMKQIKDRALFKGIPETDTIQSVLRALIPAVTESKAAAKYFLTVLGDCIVHKARETKAPCDLIYYVSPAGRKMIDKIVAAAQAFMSLNCANFVTKYHASHEFNRCRIVKLSPNCSLGPISILNMLCVAAHYACRGTGDDYLRVCGDQGLVVTALQLARHTPEQLVNQFTNQYIVAADPTTRLTTRQMTYVWRAFLSKSSLPNVIYVDGLMELLRARYEYDAETDAFVGITSGDLLQMDLFERFWEQHMRPYNVSTDFENELEIDEICAAIQKCFRKEITVTEADTVRLIRHFFPAIDVHNEKYMLHWSCDLIDKAGDVRRSVEGLRRSRGTSAGLLPFDDAYVVYCSDTLHQSVRLASKRYFYKYLQVFYAPYVVYDEFLSHDFFLK